MRFLLMLTVLSGALAHNLQDVGTVLLGSPPVPCESVGAVESEGVACYLAPENAQEHVEAAAAELGVEWFGDWGEMDGVTGRLFTLDGRGYVVGFMGEAAYVGLIEVD